MKTFTLNNNITIPAIGLGTWNNTDENTVIDTLVNALEIGYTHIDTAAVYNNEKYIGNAIKKYGIEREKLFITSKVWKTELGYQSTLRAFEKTINDLQTDYLDMYLIHWPASPSQRDDWAELNAETWHAMEDLYKIGRIRAIGVSNFWKHHLDALIKFANIRPMVNQIEHHPGYPQKEVAEYCREKNILVEAWSPLGRGSVLSNPTLIKIAEKHGVTVSQVCVAWCINDGILPLPKSTKKERLAINIDVDNLKLDDDDINLINSLNLGSSSGSFPDSVKF